MKMTNYIWKYCLMLGWFGHGKRNVSSIVVICILVHNVKIITRFLRSWHTYISVQGRTIVFKNVAAVLQIFSGDICIVLNTIDCLKSQNILSFALINFSFLIILVRWLQDNWQDTDWTYLLEIRGGLLSPDWYSR